MVMKIQRRGVLKGLFGTAIASLAGLVTGRSSYAGGGEVKSSYSGGTPELEGEIKRSLESVQEVIDFMPSTKLDVQIAGVNGTGREPRAVFDEAHKYQAQLGGQRPARAQDVMGTELGLKQPTGQVHAAVIEKYYGGSDALLSDAVLLQAGDLGCVYAPRGEAFKQAAMQEAQDKYFAAIAKFQAELGPDKLVHEQNPSVRRTKRHFYAGAYV